MPKVSYVAYIDESGDDGLTSGADEWFVLSALVVRAEAQRETIWVRNILREMGSTQKRELHFRDLDDSQRLVAARELAKNNARCFVAISNKQNMRGYENPRAAKFNTAGRTWFYWWMTRLLLERVTDYCEQSALKDYGEPRVVRLEFSRRKGLRYSHFQSYLFWLRMQSRTDTLYLKQGDLKWSVIDPLEGVLAFDHSQRAGLQLADVVAGSFYQSLTSTLVSDYAKALAPRMAISPHTGEIYNYGLKLMPEKYYLRASSPQREMLEFYRMRKWRQAPGS